ncbi:MAG: FimV/HubP family polar landmark protein [Panacagrimonas sp.]
MLRTLSIAAAFCLWVCGLPAHALGLGEIKLRSGLNQSFSAVIPITSLTAGEADSVRARLAGNEDFVRAGVDRAAYLSSVDVAVVTDDGDPRIELSSSEIAREPLISLILELSTSGGPRILREYTVFLDPPTTVAAPQAPQPSEARSETSAVVVAPVQNQTGSSPPDASTYGPVKPGESLSAIAGAVRSDDTVSLGRVMSALLAANPEAFVDGDIETLRIGVMLEVPDADTIRQSPDMEWRNPDTGSESAIPVAGTGAETQAADAPDEPPVAPAPAENSAEPAVSQTPPPVSEPAPPPPGAVAPTASALEPPPGPPAEEASDWVMPVFYLLIAAVAFLVMIAFVRAVRERRAQREYEEAQRQSDPLAPPPSELARARLRALASGEMAQDTDEEEENLPRKAALAADKTVNEDVAGSRVGDVVGVPIIIGGAASAGQPGEPGFASRFDTNSAKGDLAADDPLAEAEFHQAYGLYDEAALMLQQALAKDPARTDLSIKLAEIYFAAKRPMEFLQIAKPLKAKLTRYDWNRLSAMGHELFPDAELFAQALAPVVETPVNPMVSVDDGLEFRIEELELPMAEAPPAGAADPGLDFDLGEFDLGEAKVAPVIKPPPDSVMEFKDFDLAPGKPGVDEFELRLEDLEPLSLDDSLEDSRGSEIVGTGDDNSTKLDLARAYVEMGDAEMALSLLDEVLAAGTDDQKREAETLRARLAG